MAEFNEVAAILGILAASFPNFQIKKETVAAYAGYLADIPTPILKQAAAQCAVTCEFFPTLTKLRDMAFNLMNSDSGLPSPAEAWQEVIVQIQREGYIGKPKFSHPLIERAMLTLRGDWISLCQQLDHDQLPSERARFQSAYEVMVRREMESAKMLPEVRQMIEQLSEGKKMLQ